MSRRDDEPLIRKACHGCSAPLRRLEGALALVAVLAVTSPLRAEPSAMAPAQANGLQPEAAGTHPSGKAAHNHDGFYVRMAMGGGYFSGDWTQEGTTLSLTGATASYDFAVGDTLGSGLVLGGYLGVSVAPAPDFGNSGTAYEPSNTSVFVGLLGPMLDWYPNPTNGLHVQVALGYGGVELLNEYFTVSTNGAGVMAGVGYEAWMADQWSVGGVLRATSHYAEGDHNGFSEKMTPTTVSLLVAATYQ